MCPCIRRGDSLLTNDNRVLEVVHARTRGTVAIREAGHVHVRHMGQSAWSALYASFRHRAATAVGGIGSFLNLHHDESSGSVLLLNRSDTTCRWVHVSEWMTIIVHQRRAHAHVHGARPLPFDPCSPDVCAYRTDDMQLWMDTCTLELTWICNDEIPQSEGGTGWTCL